MTADTSKKIEQLEQEKRQLKETCDNLLETQQALEGMVAENNRRQVLAEVDSMELGQIFDAVSDATWAVRDDGIVIRANQAMLTLLGKAKEEVIGQKCSDLINYGLCDSSCCPLSIIKGHEKREYDIEIKTKTDSNQSYILSVAPLTTVIGTVATISQFKDITQRKIAENKLEELNQTLTKMARIDGLTQIANRRHFDETIAQEWARLRRAGNSLALVLADIDYFKKYNDHYGHQAGDDCLSAVARGLEQAVKRPADLVARYGGEEFVILLPDSDIAGGCHVAQLAIEAVAELNIEHQQSEILPRVSLSMGVASLIPSAEQTPAGLIALADEALYQAKEQGRNRLVRAGNSV
jgi:diguanylate cyclase (GGDEF)-like protein/PAS domain S-box-containing protein